jgi:Fic family protein
MKMPRKPPPLSDLLDGLDIYKVMEPFASAGTDRRYLHWDKLRHRKPPGDLNHEEWWAALKIRRMGSLTPIGLRDLGGRPFRFSAPDSVTEALHQIDLGAGGMVSIPEPITNPQTRDRYLVSSLMEEAITSSQLEGAVTTRDVAKEMIRAGRDPRDTSEQMILNNFVTMRKIGTLKDRELTPEIVFQIHRLITEKTLDHDDAAGRFRSADEECVVGDDYGEVYHTPPPSDELPKRLDAMCAFANGETPGYFVHPAVRAIILHFWLAYDHPFIDGNGRTARALFYWAMLRSGYWMFEFISISSILRKAPAKYGRSFLYTETDDNDLTYFLIYHTEVIRRAIEELHAYIERKTGEVREVESHLKALEQFNHRQVALLRHALKHPGQRYTIRSHQSSHSVAYQTARTDLVDLAKRDALDLTKRGKLMVFIAPNDLSDRLLTASPV